MRSAFVAILGLGIGGLLVGGMLTMARFMGPREMNPPKPWPRNFQRTRAARLQAPVFLAVGVVLFIVGVVGLLLSHQ
jgi:hypothetical protein